MPEVAPPKYALSNYQTGFLMIRAFIALELPEAVRHYLHQLGRDLSQHVPRHAVRWVGGEAMHLTLAFLGDAVTAAQLTAVTAAMDRLAAVCPPFHLSLGKLGCFPKPTAPRVIWVGVGGETRPLHLLKTTLDQSLEPLGWHPEQRKFSPHLTLGRVKDFEAMRQAFLPYGQQVQAMSFPITAVHLYQSVLTPAGAEYTTLHSQPLANS